MKRISPLILLVFATFSSFGQENQEVAKVIEKLESQNEMLRHRLDVVEKMIDDQLWVTKVGDVAHVDKVYMTGPPLRKEKNPTAQGAGNPVKFRGEPEPDYRYPPALGEHSRAVLAEASEQTGKGSGR